MPGLRPPMTPPADLPPRRHRTFLLLLASIVTMNFAIQSNSGFYSPAGIAWYAVTFVLCVLAGVQLPLGPLERLTAKHATAIGMVVVGGQGLMLILTRQSPLFYLWPGTPDQLMPFYAVFIGITLLCVNGLMRRPILGRAQGAAIAAAWAFVGAWILYSTPNPHIDTYPMAQDASAALLGGHSPYDITFEDLYPGSPLAYPPGYTANGRVLLGYSYPPLTLLMGLPGYMTTGDHRFSAAVAILGIVVMLYYLGRGTWGLLAAGVFLTCPRLPCVLESAWTEPYLLLLLTGTVFCAKHWRAGLPWVFGLFLCSKQHMILFAPAALWLMPRPLSWKQVTVFYAKAFSIGILITLPFVLWDFKAFYRSVIQIQLVYHQRLDALSFPSFFAYQGLKMPRFLSLGLVPVAYAVAWWRVPRTVWGFALTLSFVLFCTLAFDQAFLNRNFLVMTAMVLSLAALPREMTPDRPSVEATPAGG